ncbi:MAG: RNA polymerase sigma factor (sigma-70 family) [Planctomycetota bacterium]|jgi:RNA polymerase sigma factor (sigma-70 family)
MDENSTEAQVNDPSNHITELERHAGFLRHLANRSLRGEDVDDLVQDCLLIGLENSPRDSQQTFGWFRTILRRRLAENKRRAIRRENRERNWASSEAQPSALETVEHRAALRSVTDAVIDLSPELYDVVRLRYFDGMKVKQIADLRGLPERTVKYRLEMALQELRSRLEVKPQGRAALLLLGGAASQNVFDLGGWIAMKKIVLTFVIALLAIGSLSWAIWINSGDEISDLDQVKTSSIQEEVIQPRRNATAAEIKTPDSQDAMVPAVIDRDRDIFGRIVNEDYEPIEGAEIESRVHPWQRMSVLSPRSAADVVVEKTFSASDGGFALHHERGDVVELIISKPGFARLLLTRRVAGEKIDIVLHKACFLEILAQRIDGSPLPNAHITAWREAGKEVGGGQYDQRSGKTDANGLLLLEDLSPGLIKLYARHQAHKPSSFQEIDIKQHDANQITIQFADAGIVRGRVTDAKSGVGVAQAKVTVMWGSLAVKTDQDGYYERPGCPTGEKEWFNIDVEAKGFAGASQSVRFGQPSYDFEMTKGDTVVGRCVDQAGKPINGVRISMIGSTFGARGQQIDMAAAVSNPNGEFRLDDLKRTMPHTLILEAPGLGRRHLDFDSHPGDEAGTIELGDIAMTLGVRISGSVISEDGTPIVNAVVKLIGTNEDRAERRGTGIGPAQTSYGESEKRWTDDLGRFCFAHLMAGAYELKIEIFGAVPISKKVTLGSQGLDDLEILVAAPRPLLVHVLDEDGNPVPKVSVSLWSGDKEILSRYTNKSGEASFSGAPREPLTLKFSTGLASGFRHASPIDIDASVTSQTVVLARETLVTGNVVGPTGKGLSQVEVVAHLNGGEKRSVFTKRGGEFKIDLPAGEKVDLEVTGKQLKRIGQGMYTHELGAFRGRLEGLVVPSTSVVLRVERAVSTLELTVIVNGPDGRPVAGAQLYASPVTGMEARVTDQSGQVRFEGLFPNPLRLQAHPPSEKRVRYYSSKALDVTPNNQTVILTLRNARQIKGRVVLEDGAPAQKFIVEAFVNGQEHYRELTDSGGAFELTVAEGLIYTVKAYSQDWKLKGEVEGVTKGPLTIKATTQYQDKK